MAGNKVYYNDITWVKVLATLFITWFHFKWTAPSALAPIFIGGAIGNALFFYASGYLLRFREERFYGEWMIQKIIRLMPSVWVFLAVTWFLGNGISRIWQCWVYPTPFWFVNCILCFFLICFLVKRWLKVDAADEHGVVTVSRNIGALSAFTLIGYITYYLIYVDHSTINVDEGGYKFWFFSFFFFLWGYWDQIHRNIYSGTWKSVLGLMGAIVLFFIYKKIGARYEALVWAQFVFIPLLLIPIVYFGRCTASWLASFEISERAKRGLSLLSNLTLDLYIVQVFIINHLMPTMPFPVNMGVCLVVIVVAGFVNNFLAKLISKGLSRLVEGLVVSG